VIVDNFNVRVSRALCDITFHVMIQKFIKMCLSMCALHIKNIFLTTSYQDNYFLRLTIKPVDKTVNE
jgi:hypothetical protein